MKADLNELRAQIDQLDQRMVGLLNERAALAQQVGKQKDKNSAKFFPGREAEVLRQVVAVSKGPMPEVALAAIFREIIGACLSLQHLMRVSYLGPEGTFSELAARQRFGDMAELVPCASLDEVVREVETGNADVAILPIENSGEGSVGRTMDLLRGTSLSICDELFMPVHHQLLGNASGLAAITQVAAHPQALAQCRNWLAANLPHAAQLPVASNGAAAQQAANKKGCAAIASVQAAARHKLSVLSENIEDDPNNTTRFVVLGNTSAKPTGADKTSLVFAVMNTPGALLKILQALAASHINMVKLESRPAPGDAWQYVFYVDIEGHQEDSQVAATLTKIQKSAVFTKILGSYPQAA